MLERMYKKWVVVQELARGHKEVCEKVCRAAGLGFFVRCLKGCVRRLKGRVKKQCGT